MTTLQQFFQLLVGTTIITAAMLASLVWFFRQWIAVKLSDAIKHSYDEKIERLKASLSKERESDLLGLKKAIDQQQSSLAAARASISGAQSAATERRLRAIDELWKSVIQTRNVAPFALRMIDALRPEEFRQAVTKKKSHFEELGTDKLVANLKCTTSSQTDLCRPYVGDAVFGLCELYKAFNLRVVTHMATAYEKPSSEYWSENYATISVVQALLTKDEYSQFEKMEFERIHYVQRAVETRICAALAKLMSGEELGSKMIEHGRALIQKLAEFESQNEVPLD